MQSSLRATDWDQLTLSANHGISPGSQRGKNFIWSWMQSWGKMQSAKLHKFKNLKQTAQFKPNWKENPICNFMSKCKVSNLLPNAKRYKLLHKAVKEEIKYAEEVFMQVKFSFIISQRVAFSESTQEKHFNILWSVPKREKEKRRSVGLLFGFRHKENTENKTAIR